MSTIVELDRPYDQILSLSCGRFSNTLCLKRIANLWSFGMGRPVVALEIRELIRKMSQANPRWGAPRVHGELFKLGIDISQVAVSKFMIRRRKPPSQGWRTFLDNRVGDLVSIDFFTVPTATFRVLFVFVVLAHERRRVSLVSPPFGMPSSTRRRRALVRLRSAPMP